MTTEERLERLERDLAGERRRNRWLLTGAGLCLVAGLVWIVGTSKATAQAAKIVQDEIRARKFVLEDENGKTRAGLVAGIDGPALALFDENGKMRIGMAAFEFGPGLSLSDENGKMRILVAALKGMATMNLADENGKPRAKLSVPKEGPDLKLIDENGKVLWQAPP
jgi:hypothetical protein